MKQNKNKKRLLYILIPAMIMILTGAGFLYMHHKEISILVPRENQNISTEAGPTNKKDNEKDTTDPTTQTENNETAATSETETTDAENTGPESVSTEPEVTETAETTEVAADTFEDALFIGDSRTEGFVLLSGIHAKYYACKGLNVASVYTDPVIAKDGTNMTVMDAVAETEFNRVYLMFGVNETGWVKADIFIDDYRKILEDIRATHPKAEIYVQSVLPVSQAVSDTHSYVKNDKISQYNELLQKMAEEEKVTYVNVAEAVSVNGVLPDDAALDGIHLNQEYCQKWLVYLTEHTGK